MADTAWVDPNDDTAEDLEYFSEVLDGAELTGKEPKFLKFEQLDIPPAELSDKKVDELIAMYIATRNQLATDRKAYKHREEKMKLHMSIIGLLLHDKGKMSGVDSFKTEAGTAYKKKTEKYGIQVWEEFTAWLDQTKNFHVLQKRVSPVACREIREQEGAVPPGVSYFEEETFAVRSPTVRKRE